MHHAVFVWVRGKIPKAVLTFHPVDSRDPTQVIRLGCNPLPGGTLCFKPIPFLLSNLLPLSVRVGSLLRTSFSPLFSPWLASARGQTQTKLRRASNIKLPVMTKSLELEGFRDFTTQTTLAEG